MKQLLILRHGKSDWSADRGDDHARPVAPRGRRAAATVGRFLSAAGRIPDRVISSSAVRARTTAELAAEAGGWHVPIELEDALYGATPRTVLEVIRAVGDDVDTLLLAGHEPTSSATVRLLTGAHVRFPTAAVAGIDLVGRWRDVEADGGELVFLVTPKLLADGG